MQAAISLNSPSQIGAAPGTQSIPFREPPHGTQHLRYAQRSGIQPGLVRQQAVILGLSIADPVITKLVSPEALSELLAVGWPGAVVSEPPPSGTIGISSDTLGTAWQIFAASRYGIGRFEVSAPTVLNAVSWNCGSKL